MAAVSVLRIRFPSESERIPSATKSSISFSENPPSGPTMISVAQVRLHFGSHGSVWNTMAPERFGSFWAITISGISPPPESSTASITIARSLCIFASEMRSGALRSDRKSATFLTPSSLHFWTISSIFSILLGIACQSVTSESFPAFFRVPAFLKATDFLSILSIE